MRILFRFKDDDLFKVIDTKFIRNVTLDYREGDGHGDLTIIEIDGTKHNFYFEDWWMWRFAGDSFIGGDFRQLLSLIMDHLED